MAKEGKTAIVPKLRFPEFRRARVWTQQTLGSVASFFKGKSLPKSAIVPTGARPCIHYGELFTEYPEAIRDIQSRTDVEGDLFLSVENDVLMPTSDVTPGGLAKACCLSIGGVILGGDILVIRTDGNSVSGEFLARYIRYLKTKVLRLVSGSTVYHLYASSMQKLELSFPSKAEQQKIADCLSSLDELIAAQGRKVGSLKTYKRGLMQQLFPREGEPLPRLRFPEFRDAPEWISPELGSMTSKVGSGITPLGGDKNYKAQGRPFVRSQNIGWGELLLSDVAYIDEETHRSFDATEIQGSDVLLNITGASIGRSAVADSRIVGGNVNQHVCIIRVKADELNPIFLSHFLISERGQNQIDGFQAGGNRQGLNFAQIRTFEIPTPPTVHEQHRVAECLSSLDAQIAVQSKKLEALKAHKSGLMQQLFPSLEEE